jgi:tetratricopeptide (TPR) repeat protein
MARPRSLIVLVCLLALMLLSQGLIAQIQRGNVHVYVTFADDRAVPEQLKLSLVSGSNGNQVAQTFTNDHGQAQFTDVVIGNYRVVVSGQGIQTTESEEFEIDARKGAQSVFIRVRANAENGEARSNPGNATVSTADLKVPKEASKEFDKATELMSKQKWNRAIERLNKAVTLYPNYAQAYNNLGVAYARLGDADKEREALQQAVTANDHFAPAFLNLGQMEMKLQNFNAAENDLEKASLLNSGDVRTLVLLAQAELLNTHFQEVIATAHKVHAMSHASFARIHYRKQSSSLSFSCARNRPARSPRRQPRNWRPFKSTFSNKPELQAKACLLSCGHECPEAQLRGGTL